MESKINIQGLKRAAIEKLPSDSHLRELILTEPDNIDAWSFPIKVGLWLRLNLIEIRAMEAVKKRGKAEVLATPARDRSVIQPTGQEHRPNTPSFRNIGR